MGGRVREDLRESAATARLSSGTVAPSLESGALFTQITCSGGRGMDVRPCSSDAWTVSQ